MQALLAIWLPLLIGYVVTLQWVVDRWNAPTLYYQHGWLLPFVAIAMPSAPGLVRQEIVEACRKAGIPCTTLPGLRGCHILEGAGHWVQRERAAQVNELLLGFLRGL